MDEIVLEIAEKDAATELKKFNQETITIGRVAGNDIVLPRGNISKKHSRLVLKDGQLIIVDLKSTNGTYVNGKRISAPQVLNENDKIYLGDFTVSIKASESVTAALSNADVIDASEEYASNNDEVDEDDDLDQIFDLSEDDEDHVIVDDLPSLDDDLLESNIAEPSREPSIAEEALKEEASIIDDDDDFDLSADPALEALFNDDSAAFDLSMDLEPPEEARREIDHEEQTAFEREPPRSLDKPVPLGSFLDADVDVDISPEQAANDNDDLAGIDEEASSPVTRRLSNSGDQRDQYSHVYRQILSRLYDVDSSGYRDPIRVDAILEQVQSGLDTLIFGEDWKEQVREELIGYGRFGQLMTDESLDSVMCQGVELRGRTTSGSIKSLGRLSCIEATLDIISRCQPLTQVEKSPVLRVKSEDGQGVITIFNQQCDEQRPSLVFQRRHQQNAELVSLVKSGFLSKRMAQFLDVCVQKKANILFSSASPEMTSVLIEALMHRVHADSWLGIVDRFESLSMLEPRSLRLGGLQQTGQAIIEGVTSLSPRHLIVHPVIDEAHAVLNWMRSGGLGLCASIRSLHASEAVETLVQHAVAEHHFASVEALRSQLVNHIDVVVHIGRLADGRPTVLEIVEPTDTDMELVTCETIYRFEQNGMDPKGQIQGEFSSAGYVPRFYDRLKSLGHQLDISIFKG